MKQHRSANSPEVQRLLDSRPALRRAVIDSSIPIPIEELLEAQAAMFYQRSDDSEEAAAALRNTNPAVLLEAMQAGPSPRLAEFCLRQHSNRDLRAAAVRHRALEPWILAELASAVGPDLQRVLIQRQDAMAAEPRILERLRGNPDLASDVARRVRELEDLASAAPRGRGGGEEAEIVEATEEEVVEAIEAAKNAPVQGDVDEQTLLSEGQIRLLPPSVKLRLCTGAGVRLRNFLVRDPNPYVAKSVLQLSSFTGSEVARIARSRTVQDEVLETIANDRRWSRKYQVRRALVSNPKTPVGIALKLLPGIAPRDLKELRRDRNISDAVRSRARQLYRVRVG